LFHVFQSLIDPIRQSQTSAGEGMLSAEYSRRVAWRLPAPNESRATRSGEEAVEESKRARSETVLRVPEMDQAKSALE
jgi:hypothetical protein